MNEQFNRINLGTPQAAGRNINFGDLNQMSIGTSEQDKRSVHNYN